MDDKASGYFAGIFLIFLSILAVFMVTFIDNANAIIQTLHKEKSEFCNPVREPILKDVNKSNKLWSNIAAFRWLYLVKVGSQWDSVY